MSHDTYLHDTWDTLVAEGEDIFHRCSVCGHASNELMPCNCGACDREYHQKCAPHICEECGWPICKLGVVVVDGVPNCGTCAPKVIKRLAEMVLGVEAA